MVYTESKSHHNPASFSNREDLKALTPHFEPATLDQVERLAEWDSAAKLASTGSGYTEARKVTVRKYFEERFNDPAYEIVTIRVPGVATEPIGSVIIHHAPHAIDIEEVGIGEPFSLEASLPPMDIGTLGEVFANSSRFPHRAHLDSIAIDESVQGKGLGKIIFAELIQYLKQENVDVVTFDTGVENIKMQRIGKDFTFMKVESEGEGYPGERLIAALILSDESDSEEQLENAREQPSDVS